MILTLVLTSEPCENCRLASISEPSSVGHGLAAEQWVVMATLAGSKSPGPLRCWLPGVTSTRRCWPVPFWPAVTVTG
ncbi:hypothetical protein [Lysobacter sp. A3-1-A15]|uniref:hypothetical protein n=1 Tax=Novilysobacter viscosus TaxID=3098602 RepID=UPI002EDBAC8D